MIFAAGFGTRMMPLTRDRPKPMLPVAGRPLIDHALDLARAMRPTTIVANLHYKAEVLDKHLDQTEVQTIHETPDILDTGGGLRHALPLLGPEPVWTLNPDVIWRGPNPLAMLRAAWQPDKMDALLMCIPAQRTSGRILQGDFHLDDTGRLSRGPGLIYGGAQIMRTERLKTVSDKAFSLNLIWDQMIADGRCFGLEYPGHWSDIGHPEGITLVEKLLSSSDV